jgi:hypothetical protein
MRFSTFGAATLLAAITAANLAGQTSTATLVGTVMDTTGAVIPKAAVQVKRTDTSEVRGILSDEKGQFTSPNLAPGVYEVIIASPGFQMLHQSNVELAIDQVARLEFRLEIGAASQSVEVNAVAASVPTINTENGTKGEVMVAKEIVEMPLNGRDFTDLAVLVPGVVPRAAGGQGSGYNINGARADNTNFVIDGFNDQNPRGAAAQARPNLDALQEFKMQTSNYSAENGRLAGGVMNMVIKSGGNQYHGALFEFIRNDLFDARSFFDDEKSHLRQNQFGGVISGPVSVPKVYRGRDRTFFLFSWETYLRNSGQSKLGLVPTPAQIAGDFTGFNPIADPLTTGTCKGVQSNAKGACFPNNIIPASRISPQAKQIAAFYPKPNVFSGLNNFLSDRVAPNNWNSWLTRIDQNVSAKHHLSFRYTKKYNSSYGPYANANSTNSNDTGMWGQYVHNHQTLTGLTWTYIFNGAMINEARMGFSRTAEEDTGVLQGIDFNAQFELTGTTKDPRLVGMPLIVASGYQQIGGGANLPVAFYVNNFTPGDTFTWVRNEHLFKFGGDILRTQFNQPYWNNNRGTFKFTGAWTGDPAADLMLGLLNSTSRQVGTTTNYFRSTNYGFFASDDWKITPRLTLNLGLRYELPLQPHDKYGRITNWDLDLKKLVVADLGTLNGTGFAFSNPNLVVDAKTAGLPTSLVEARYNDLAPRFGFAWRPFGGNRTAVRGGYGIFYGGTLQNPLRNNLANSFPFALSQTINRNTSKPEFLTLASPFPTDPNLVGNLSTLTMNSFEVRAKTPYLQSWNFTVEREVGASSAIEMSYTGSKGTHFGILGNINQPMFRSAALPNGVVPFAGWGTINQFMFESNSNYNAGTVSFRRRFVRGFFFTLNYTYSKCLDDASQLNGASDGGYNGLQDPRNLHGDYGRCDWDIGHNFVGNFSWTVPNRNRFIRGWQLTGTHRLYSGSPITPQVTNTNLTLGEANRPDRIGSGKLANPTADLWYNVADFPQVPDGGFRLGNSGRGIIDGPGRIEVNLSLFKNFVPIERTNLQFRWEVFNVLNHANLGVPVVAVNAGNAGSIVSSDNGRLMQFGIRFTY